MSKYRVLFLTIGEREWASSRFRSYWPSDQVDGWDPQVFKTDGTDNQISTEYDAYIWMKVGNLTAMEQLAELGKLQIVDVCDPNWWYQPDYVRKMIDLSDCVVSATAPARDDLLRWYGDKRCYVMPDRMNMEHYTTRRDHHWVDPVRFIWYGMVQNRITVVGAMPVLERLKVGGVNIELTILDNGSSTGVESEYFPVYHVKWSLEKEIGIIASHDIALLPPFPGPWGKIKSNNKKLTAWACGLPVTDGYDYYDVLELATRSDIRQERANEGFYKLTKDYTVEKTVEQWETIIDKELSHVQD